MNRIATVHRVVGTVICLVMLSWCTSGAVMIYVPYPELAERARLAHLRSIDWQWCCDISLNALDDQDNLETFQIEMLDSTPVARLRRGDGRWLVIDLHSGSPLSSISAQQALAVAHAWSAPSTASVRELMTRDQWTLANDLDSERPLYRIAVDDLPATEIYVSSITGKVVQVTTTAQRFWNYFGAVPHWLYVPWLRHRLQLWRLVVIAGAATAMILAGSGLLIGVYESLTCPAGWSPHRGLMRWHHLGGLIFGTFAFAWSGSGLLSMNPLGFLNGSEGWHEPPLLSRLPATAPSLRAALRSLHDRLSRSELVSIESAPFAGRLYMIAIYGDGSRKRLDSSGIAQPLGSSDLREIANTVAGSKQSSELIAVEDDYYYSHADDAVTLPAYRIISNDENRIRYYVDPISGALLKRVDRADRWYRWLYRGVHTFDFSVARQRPLRDIALLGVLSGVFVVVVSGGYAAARRVFGAAKRALRRSPDCESSPRQSY